MDKLWFENELFISNQALPGISNHIAKLIKGNIQPISEELCQLARGIVRAQKPDWELLKSDEKQTQLISGHKVRFFKARLIFEFEVFKENYDKGARFVYARCAANIRSINGPTQPEVYDLYPHDFYEGEPQKVSLKFGPSITVDKIGVSVGKIDADIAVGQITPVIVGYFGNEKQEPHWELRPKSKSLLGRQYLWLVLALPEGCEGIRLASRVEADIQTKFGPISVGPKEMAWNDRPSIVIR